mgnify:CR=1 FL=1|tara:strand:- start:4161 stop:4544 length:384 start_codon:yes stop_codon:yes gene_type:complete
MAVIDVLRCRAGDIHFCLPFKMLEHISVIEHRVYIKSRPVFRSRNGIVSLLSLPINQAKNVRKYAIIINCRLGRFALEVEEIYQRFECNFKKTEMANNDYGVVGFGVHGDTPIQLISPSAFLSKIKV